MRFQVFLPLLLIPLLFALASPGAGLPAASMLPDTQTAPQTAPQATPPPCARVCNKAGVNLAMVVGQPESTYLRAQRLGMSWVLEIAYDYSSLYHVVEAINRANAHGLTFVLRICAGSTCGFSDPDVYARFLREVAGLTPVTFWALAGPNEPQSELWAGDSTGVTRYMNRVIALTGRVRNLRLLSPGFNITSSDAHNYFRRMETAGARFAALDGFAATSYWVAGHGNYYWYASNVDHAETFRRKMLRYGKQMLFIEYGTFSMFDKPGEGNPARQMIVDQMQEEFDKAAADATVMGMLHYDGFGTSHTPHRYYDKEIAEIQSTSSCASGEWANAGIGVYTDHTAWHYSSEQVCREVILACPWLDGASECAGEPPLLVPGHYENPDTRFDFNGLWQLNAQEAASGGSYHSTRDPNARVSFWFAGHRFAMYRTLGPDRGRGEICIDGRCRIVENYGDKLAFAMPVVFDVGPGIHHVVYRNLSGAYIDLDAIHIDLSGTVPPPK